MLEKNNTKITKIKIALSEKAKYYDLINPQFIDWDFYKSFIDKEPDFGKLGLIVFLRTYSRFIPKLKRREKWCETVLRVVEYNISLDTVTSKDELKKEAKKLFQDIFEMKTFVSGRSFWIGGTSITKNHGSPIFNCTYRSIDDISSFSEIYYWLLIGAGAGFSVERKHFQKLPNFYKNISLIHHSYKNKSFTQKVENTTLSNKVDTITFNYDDLIKSDNDYFQKIYNFLYRKNSSQNNLNLVIGDSKEGWVNAIRILLTIHTIEFFNNINIEINYNYIRPEGERLKQFGGRASGYKALKNSIEKIEKWIMKNESHSFSSVTIVDIITSLGEGVIAGGVRRVALIAIGDSDDYNFINMKKNLWTDENMKEYRNNRVLSNNSIALYEKPSKENLKQITEVIRTNGEPGFVCLGNLKQLREGIEGTNPCGEILLKSKQCCNLTTENLCKFVKTNPVSGDKYLDEMDLFYSTNRITRAGSRMTMVNQWHPDWDKIQKEDRLLGQSMTGIMDAFEKLGVENDYEYQKEFYQDQKLNVRTEADLYHNDVGIERSTSVTTIKPEGSISQLPTVSSGIHRSYSPYYQRNIRFSKTDPLSQAIKDMDVPVSPENGQGNVKPKNLFQKILKMLGLFKPSNEDKLFADDCNTWVFGFPVETSTSIRQIDESAVTQLNRYKVAQQNYIESHNVSITVNVGNDEWNNVVNWLYENYHLIGNISLMPKFDPDNAPYPNLPYLPLTKKQYENMEKSFPKLYEEELIQKIKNYEQIGEEYKILDDDCKSGSCPVR